ncbi:hypothetical protein KKA23_00055 [Patescibacteria group bacterium]|nr:hypothetical protein [Patescibacteria group bacterium]
MVDVQKKPRETSSSLIRRFTQKVRESNILMEAKKARFQEKDPSRSERRKQALERNKKRREKQRLKRMGRI